MTENLDRLLLIMRRLRDPVNGCPWDLEQDLKSLAPYTLEEAYEVVDAIEKDDPKELKLELGDLLLQIVFQSQIACEQGLFEFNDVAGAISDKMIARHPHVFPEHHDTDVNIKDAKHMASFWEDQKARERDQSSNGRAGHLDDVLVSLPALTRAVKLQKRAARVGFDWTKPEQILDKVEEEIAELRVEIHNNAAEKQQEELGDLLFVMANLARRLDIDPETALRQANDKFTKRFNFIEKSLDRDGKSLAEADLDEMEALWQLAKESEQQKTVD